MSIKVYSSSTIKKPQFVKSDAVSSIGFEVDFAKWLPFAAECYNISRNPKDYLLYPVPILYSDLPNRNGIGMPLSELTKWNRERGTQAFAAWKGMPMFKEHSSDVVKEALGVIADTALRPITGFGNGKFYKVMALAALDRSKGAEYVSLVERGEVNSYSMGAMVESWSCAYCGAGEGKCNHIDPKKPVNFYELNGRLVFKNVHDINPYELSIVKDPAYPTAISDTQITF